MVFTMVSRPLCLAALSLALCSGQACADIYRYVNANGGIVFTDMRPSGRPYKVVVKDSSTPAPAAPRAPLRAVSAEERARYAGHILSAAKASNLEPELIHAVISAESGYNPFARSRKGAVGLMQLMPETALRYSVRNRLDPAQNIDGGTRYLRDLLRMFNNDLRLALAAYNAGENAVVKYGNRIPPYPETVAYVPRVLSYYRMYRADRPG
jgi:soluble lytic murein transglycosylase-like protein